MLRVFGCCLLCCLLLQGACGAQVSEQFEPAPGEQQPTHLDPLHVPVEEEPMDEALAQSASDQRDAEPAAAVNVASSVPAPYPAEAMVGWLHAEPLPGTRLRLRLRDAALYAVLDPELRWEVVAVGPASEPTRVAAVLEQHNGQPGWPLYTVDAAYTPSRGNAESGNNYWPLLLPSNRLPLAKLKLVAQLPSAGTPFAKAVDIVRLTDDGSVLRSLASGIVNPEGVAGAGPNWFELKPESAAETWAVEVHETLGAADSTDAPMLHLTKIDAYAAEVFIRCEQPEAAELRLRIYPVDPGMDAAAIAPTQDELLLAAADTPGLFGELRTITPFTPEPAQHERPARLGLPDMPQLPSLPGWVTALVLGVAGLLLLLLGIRLMQPPRQN